MSYEVIHKNMKFLRQLYGYSQQYISDFLHMSKSTYCALETGKKSPDWECLCVLSRLYSLDCYHLVCVDITRQTLTMLHTDHVAVNLISFIERFLCLSPYSRDLIKSQIISLYESEED